MERFKQCEKEMKTKAYSKEGLLQSGKIDPKEKEKMELMNWISTMVEKLSEQVEKFEAEAEALQLGTKKGKKSDPAKAERLEDIEYNCERHRWHMGKLELIMRLLENGNILSDQVMTIKEDILYYVEQSQVSLILKRDIRRLCADIHYRSLILLKMRVCTIA
jgi:CCR4-NOT transcription complex subunit 3